MYIGISVIMYLQNPMGKILLIAGIAVLRSFGSIRIVGVLIACTFTISSWCIALWFSPFGIFGSLSDFSLGVRVHWFSWHQFFYCVYLAMFLVHYLDIALKISTDYVTWASPLTKSSFLLPPPPPSLSCLVSFTLHSSPFPLHPLHLQTLSFSSSLASSSVFPSWLRVSFSPCPCSVSFSLLCLWDVVTYHHVLKLETWQSTMARACSTKFILTNMFLVMIKPWSIGPQLCLLFWIFAASLSCIWPLAFMGSRCYLYSCTQSITHRPFPSSATLL